MLDHLIQHISLAGVFLSTVFILLAVFKGGVILGQRHKKNWETDDRSSINSIVAATLGLLAFLLAFTFGISASKFDERRKIVLDESNAVGTTFLRAGYLSEPYKSEIRNLLREYVSVRLAALDPTKLEYGIQRSEEIQDELWSRAVSIAEKHPESVVAGLFIQSLNELIDLHTLRLNIGVRFRLPIIIWAILYFVTILAFGAVGYQLGLFHAHYTGITVFLILIFSAVIALIADLDRPQEGSIKVSQESLIDLMKKFDS